MKRHVGSNPTVSAIFVKSARLALADLVLFRYFDGKPKEENAFIAEFSGMPAFSQGRTEGRTEGRTASKYYSDFSSPRLLSITSAEWSLEL